MRISNVVGGVPADTSNNNFTIYLEAPPADFSIHVRPDTLRVARGYSGDYKVVLTSINGFASNCTLTVTEDYPDGATAIFNPPKLVPTDSSILTLTIPANTPEDTFTLTITATEMVKGKGIAHSKDVTLIVVLPAGYFKVDAFPDTQIISQGGSTTYDVTIIPSEDFTAPCTLFVEFVGGLPSGVTADFDSNPIPPNDTSTLTITTQLSTPYGEYDLAIIAVANHEQRDTTYVKLIIGLVANFSAQPTTGPVPLVVNFTDLTLGNPTSWFWYFGDDSASTLPDPIHIYRDTGYYDVKLVVSNGTETDSLIRHNYIQVVPPVVADFSGNPRSGFVSLMVQFTDSSEGNPTSWFWDFGDDSISTERNPIHTYSDTGYFSVKLVASNQWDSDSITKPNYIHVLPHLTADFSASPDSGLRPLSVRFTDLSVGGPTGWLWHFGDGDSSTQRNPVHVYSCEDTGYFDVRLIVWNQTERDTLIKENCIYVSPGVGAKFVAVPTSGAVPLTVQFIDSSLGCPSLWLWNFGDDSTDTTQNPLHTYNDTGYYDVRLIVSSEVDSDTIIKENYIHVLPPNPVLSWADRLGYQIDGVSPDTGLSGSLFTFRVVYTDPRNFAPEGGYPKVNIDLNGDGDFEDENEGSFTMGVVNADTNYTDGREYFYNVVLPASSDCQYSFSAKNSYGLDAVGEPTILKPGPVILDPSTALDLYIYASDITFSDPHPDEGEVFTVFATIHNNSDSNLTNVSVTFYHSGQPPNQVFIPNISSRSSATTSIPLSFDTKGFYPIKVVVDEENSFEEWNELNNFAIRPIIVGDYEFPGGIVVEAQLNSPVYPYSWITVTGNAHYTPEYLGVVSGATVTITIQETGAEYTTYTNDLGNFSMGFYGPDLAGNYSVKVEVTDYTLIDSTILDLEVISQPGVDLAIRINLSKMDSLLQAEQDTLHTRIFNFGSEDAHNFSLGIYKDALLYYSYWVDSLLAGDSLAIPDSVISFDSSGWHTVSGLVDVGDSVEEYNEGNNLSSFGFYVWCNAPDVHIIKLIFSDDSPKGQQPIDITAWVVNSGGVGVVQTFGVQFLDNGVPFDTGYINSLAPFDAETAYVVSDSFIYSDSIQHSFSVFADFQNVIAECNEGNNTYGGGPCIDLKTSYYDINFSDTDPQVGDTVRIIAKVFNLGNISTFNSQVRFKIDGIQIGQDVIIPRINPGGSETVYSSQAWQFNPSACSLVVQCDPANSIIECNEVNNSAYCPLPYDVYPYYACRCPQEYPYVFPYVFSVCATVVDSPVTIFGALRNSGGFDITGQVQIEVTDNIEGLLGIITVDSVLNHGSNIASGDLQHAFANYGWHTVTLRADYNNQYYECGRESNNTYSASIFVDSLRPDLEVHSEYIQFSDDCPNWGDSLWFRVSTYNIGQSRAENVWIRFLVDELQIGADILIDSIPVGPNNYHTDTSTAPWIVPEELDVTHVCKVIVDPNNQILEVREDNNEATRALPVVRCGDVNRDCVVNIADVVYLINYLYIGGTAPEPWQTGDVNCDGTINVSDVVYLINYLFIGGPPPGC
jgi:PKD repeat protein